ncbi:hypothetical protein HanHA300_Chr15g0587841 [Helianthus annuus]|nr:hypothetical protein HanHA300_Chr15g0587841 [Helianthus annuus]KAJ0475130.1 hypothetical protein HanHA89_Chr15g0637661 [Helianthus annuus]KAJ0650685.1 hypothetical protein HanLR1_Chr15g0598571 [Helianthus annuus]KAJ0654437.1 hypothetical protein HanOQP8_Chr15g0594981 [Helianthus annuus]
MLVEVGEIIGTVGVGEEVRLELGRMGGVGATMRQDTLRVSVRTPRRRTLTVLLGMCLMMRHCYLVWRALWTLRSWIQGLRFTPWTTEKRW